MIIKYPQHLITQDKEIHLTDFPRISIIILTQSNTKLLFECIYSILKQNYSNLELIIGDTGSDFISRKKMENFFNNLNKDFIKVVWGLNYHFSQNNNYLVENFVSENTECLIFCNNGINLQNNVIPQLIDIYNQFKDKAGCLGVQLISPNLELQHQAFRIKEIGENVFHLSYDNPQIAKFSDNPEIVSGVSGAFLMINKKLFEKIGEFSEKYYSVFQDAELNLQCFIEGKVNICLNSAVAVHHENNIKIFEQKAVHKDARIFNMFVIYFKDFFKEFIKKDYIKKGR
jgi:GT2 family glycosyltransferase